MLDQPRRRGRTARIIAVAGVLAGCSCMASAQQVVTRWASAQSGSFFDAFRWTGGVAPNNDDVPGTTYRALIDLGGSSYTVTLGSDVTLDELLVNSASARLMHTSGVLHTLLGLNVSLGRYTLNGGRIADTTINVTGGIMECGSAGGSVLDGVTLNGDLSINAAGSRVAVVNGLTLNGTVHLSSDQAQIGFTDNATLQQGTIAFEGTSGGVRRLSTEAGRTLTLGGGVLVQATAGSQGNIGNGYLSDTNTSVVNQGTITSTGANSRINIVPTSFVNQGTINASAGGTISLAPSSGGSWSNSGTINVSGGTLLLGGNFTVGDLAGVNATSGSMFVTGTMDASAGFFVTSSGVNFGVRSGSIVGGFINAIPGSPLLIQQTSPSNPSVLSGVTVIGDINVNDPNIEFRIDYGLTHAGTLNFNAGTTTLRALTSQTIDGSTVNFNAPVGTTATQWVIGNSLTLTLSNTTTVHGGRGAITGTETGARLVNNGTINADRAGQTLGITPRIFNNNGSLLVNGGTLALGAPAGTNNGTITVNSGTLDIGGTFTQGPGGTISQTGGLVLLTGAINNAGMAINLNGAASTWRLALGNSSLGGAINGGSVSIQNGATFDVARGVLNGVAVGGSFALGVAHQLTVQESLSLNGQITVGDGLLRFEAAALPGTITMNGGTVAVSRSGFGSGSDAIVLTPGRTLVLSPTTTVRGGRGNFGTPTTNGPANSIVNQGLISADATDKNLTIKSGVFQNSGIAEATNGGVLEVSYDTTWSNSGIIRATSGGVLLLSGRTTTPGLGTVDATGGTFYFTGLLDNTGHTFAPPASMGTMLLTNSGALKGGTVDLTQGGHLAVSNGPAILDGTSLVGTLDILAFGDLQVRNGLSLNGDLRLSGSSSKVRFAGEQTLASGRIVFDPVGGGSDRLLQALNEGVFTIGSGASVVGGRGVVFTGNANGNRSSIINQGLIRANIAGEQISVYTTRLSNEGTIEAVDGGTITFVPPGLDPGNLTIFNDGLFSLASGSVFSIQGSLVQSSLGMLGFRIGDDADAYVTPLRITDLLSLEGGLTVVLDGSVIPAYGSSFDLFSAAQVHGRFSSLALPTLTGGLEWDLSSLYTGGRIVVVPSPLSFSPFFVAGLLAARRRRPSAVEVRS